MRNLALNAPGTARDNIKHAWPIVINMILTAKSSVASKWPSVWHRAHATKIVNLDAIIVTRASAVVNWTHHLRRLNVKNKLRISTWCVWARAQKMTLNVSVHVGEKMPN